jgi:hypothetical protein
MAVFFSNGFETGDFTGWTSQGGTPTVDAAYKYSGTYGMRVNWEGASWTRYNDVSGTQQMATRFYMYIEDAETSSSNFGVFSAFNAGLTRDLGLRWDVSAGNAVTMQAYIYDGSTTTEGTASGTLTQDTWLRIELKADLSGAAPVMTWGHATGDGALTTVQTDFTAGADWGTDVFGYHLYGTAGFSYNRSWLDDVSIANSTSDYPIGPLSTSNTTLLTLLGVG